MHQFVKYLSCCPHPNFSGRKLLKFGAATAFFWLLLLGGSAHAQLVLEPIYPHSPADHQRKSSHPDTIFQEFPFFDDFSEGLGAPSPERWVIGDSTPIVNNSFGIDPPSAGVVTFDGADFNGNPYDFVNVFRSGIGDRLVSQFFDLELERPSDSVYISFYWQAEGFGETPATDDSLRLQMIDRNGTWSTIWSVGGTASEEILPFRFEKVPIENGDLLHAHSQFRFVNDGRLAGGFDTWNVDYILFYRKRDLQERWIDIAINQKPTSLFKPYYAMPMRQFLIDPSAYTADSVFASIRNLSDTFNLFSPTMLIEDARSGELLAELPTGAIGANSGFSGTNLIERREQMQLVGLNDLSFIDGSQDSLSLRYAFLFDTLRAERFARTRYNDTLSFETELSNYYAYDDGTAEYAIAVYQRFVRVAYRFVLNEPDILEAVDFYIPPIRRNLAGQTFNLLIWQKIDTVDQHNDVQVHRQNVPVVYTDAPNKFQRVMLSQKVLVSDTFYVGYEQLTEEPLTIGYDKNTDSGQEVFFNVSSKWQQNILYGGSLMIRPVLVANRNPTSLAQRPEPLDFTLYPNPASNSVTIGGEVQWWRLLTLSGKLLQQGEVGRVSKRAVSVDLAGLSPGLYLIQAGSGKSVGTKKLIVE